MSPTLETFIDHMIAADADSLFMIANARPFMRRHSKTVDLSLPRLKVSDIESLVDAFPSKARQQNTDSRMSEVDFSIGLPGRGRFRINAYRQRGSLAVSIRRIRTEIASLESLHLPDNIPDMVLDDSGFILIAGPGSSGKSYTLAALIEHRNMHREGYILTIEDPIEYIFHHNRSVIAQRELQIDTASAEEAYISASRQSPNMTVVGEIRDPLAMRHTLSFAESGNLCLATIRASNTVQALRRMIAFFPPEQQDYALDTLAVNLRCIISQRLLPGKTGESVAIYETLYINDAVSQMIRQRDIKSVEDHLKNRENKHYQMPWDRSLVEAVERDAITSDTALEYAKDKRWVELEIQRRLDLKTISNRTKPI